MRLGGAVQVKALIAAALADHVVRVAGASAYRGSGGGDSDRGGDRGGRGRLTFHDAGNCGLHAHPSSTLAAVPAPKAGRGGGGLLVGERPGS